MADKEIKVSLPTEWAFKKVLGPTFDKLGKDLADLYDAGRDRVIKAAEKKINDDEDNKEANLRVARDVIWNGSFSESQVCAEYFGGVLASSRSEDGSDDEAVYYTDIIKSLSSKQLHFHYIIYNSLQKEFLDNPDKFSDINVGMASELSRNDIYFSTIEIDQSFDLEFDKSLFALDQNGLIETFEANKEEIEDGFIPYIKVKPSVLGVQLYAVAFNKIDEWRSFNSQSFGDLDQLKHVSFVAQKPKNLPTIQGGLIMQNQ